VSPIASAADAAADRKATTYDPKVFLGQFFSGYRDVRDLSPARICFINVLHMFFFRFVCRFCFDFLLAVYSVSIRRCMAYARGLRTCKKVSLEIDSLGLAGPDSTHVLIPGTAGTHQPGPGEPSLSFRRR